MPMPLFTLALPLALSFPAAQSAGAVPAADGYFLYPNLASAVLPDTPAAARLANVPEVAVLHVATAPVIEGPVFALRPRVGGPLFELGALGGGADWAPGLAHVAMDWRF